MCRYGIHEYKRHYICLLCQIGFKSHGEPPCPNCGGTMIRMGKDFKVPRRDDDQQWNKVRVLVIGGLLFASCGCTGPGYAPKNTREARWLVFARQRERRTNGAVLLETIQLRETRGQR